MSTLFTVRAAAARLGVGYSTLKQWIYDGAVRTVRTRGGHHRLTELEVQRLLLSGTGGPGAAPARAGRTLSLQTAPRCESRCRGCGSPATAAEKAWVLLSGIG